MARTKTSRCSRCGNESVRRTPGGYLASHFAIVKRGRKTDEVRCEGSGQRAPAQ